MNLKTGLVAAAVTGTLAAGAVAVWPDTAEADVVMGTASTANAKLTRGSFFLVGTKLRVNACFETTLVEDGQPAPMREPCVNMDVDSLADVNAVGLPIWWKANSPKKK